MDNSTENKNKGNNWTINGIRPRMIERVDQKGLTVTLHCLSLSDDKFPHPRDEIEQFTEFSSHTINSTPLLNGGMDVQCSKDGKIVAITEDDKSYEGAIEYPKYHEYLGNNCIKYDIVMHLKKKGNREFKYVQPLDAYPNLKKTHHNAFKLLGFQ
jgi:hypothetical protein